MWMRCVSVQTVLKSVIPNCRFFSRNYGWVSLPDYYFYNSIIIIINVQFALLPFPQYCLYRYSCSMLRFGNKYSIYVFHANKAFLNFNLDAN